MEFWISDVKKGIHSFDLRIIMKLLRKKIMGWMGTVTLYSLCVCMCGWQKDTKFQMRHFSTQTKTPFNQSTMKNNTILTHNVRIQNHLWCEVCFFFLSSSKRDTWFKAVRSHFSVPCHEVSTHGIPTQKCEYTKIYTLRQHRDIR